MHDIYIHTVNFHWYREISLQQAKQASRLEEEFQVEIWGVVEGGHDMDRFILISINRNFSLLTTISRLNNTVNLASVNMFMHMYWSPLDLVNIKSKWENL
jgi:hypothetical protein